MRSMVRPSLSHQTERRERLYSPLGLAKGTPPFDAACGVAQDRIVAADRLWQAAFLEEAQEHLLSGTGLYALKSFASQNEAGGMVGDGERVTVSAIAELELPFEIDAPQIVGGLPIAEWCALGLVAAAVFGSFDQPVPVEHGMDRALGGDADIAGQPPDQELSDLPRPPVRLLTLTVNNQPF